MDDLFPPFGDLLRSLQKRNRITQRTLAVRLGVHRNTIGLWERGDVLPDTKAKVLELADALCLTDIETRLLLDASMTSVLPYWYLPFPQNPFFVGRDEVLRALHEQMMAREGTSMPIYAIQGMGGMGKTQVAIAYAYRFSFEYTALLWIEAETPETILASFRHLAGVLHLPQRREMDPHPLVEAVQQWLSSHTQWLLIWDGLEDLDVLLRFLSPLQQGSILLTTHNQVLGPVAQGIELRPMTQEEGIRFLVRRTRALGVQASSAQMQWFAEHMPTQYAAAHELAMLLGGLPLALDQAGAYIDETGCSFSDYVHHYKEHPMRLLDRRGTSEGAHPLAVAATFLRAKEHVEQEMRMAADMVCVFTVWHTNIIPVNFFLAGASSLGPAFAVLATDPLQLDLAIAVLRRLSLVQRHPEEQTLSFHPLLQVVLYEQMSGQERVVRNTRVAATASVPDQFTVPKSNGDQIRASLPVARTGSWAVPPFF